MDRKCIPVVDERTVSARIDYAKLIEKDRIHSSVYTSDAIFQDEMEKIFARGWVFVGHDSEIPNPGDYICRTIGVEPTIMLRNRQGEIRVFSNRCMHRGNKLCSREKGSAKALTCDYHGWTFSLDGDLVGVPYPGGFEKDKGMFGLHRPAKVESYGGFVFATFNPSSISLEEHLGHAKHLIDRAVSMSPTGRIKLTAGWVKQHYSANWKMLPENDTDGYHANYVHSSFLRVFPSQYDVIKNKEEERQSRIIDWGQGHTAIDASVMYREPYEWLGVKPEKVAEYTRLMTEAYGAEKATKITIDGPPHAVVFPNLFLGEMNIVIFQPISANESVQWHTPLLLEGAPDDFNSRIIRQSEAAMGPSAFLLADDSVISERQQQALSGHGGWLELSRGLNRESESDGVIMSHVSDETSNRGFWRHYRKVMGEE
jgi:phenylpropionate dioxygenase-like ring-hydroxylating dioxygenase large terminal subunit